MADETLPRKPAPGNAKLIDITGQRFYRLTVIERVPGPGGSRWLCRCDCGGTSTVRSINLRKGITRSCGCLHREVIAAIGRVVAPKTGRLNATHGHSVGDAPTRTYRSWATMKVRCTNPKSRQWPWYGGRGIKVCERWLNSFENFLADMGERPEGMTLDRYPDKDGNYEPGNCRWATPKEQAANRRKPGDTNL